MARVGKTRNTSGLLRNETQLSNPNVVFGKANPAGAIGQMWCPLLNHFHMKACGCSIGCVSPRSPLLNDAPAVSAGPVWSREVPAPSTCTGVFFPCTLLAADLWCF